MKKVCALLCLTVLLAAPFSAFAEAEEENKVYELLDENGETVTLYAGTPDAGDEYIAENNRHYRVIQVDPDSGKARMESLGDYSLPDVSWLDEDSQPVSTNKKAVAMYCTHSDENHYPHDAGAYRRSRATAASLAEEGVDAIFDVHRDGIPDASQYESQVKGEDVTKVRLLVGRQNQNADANKQFAAQIKAVADKLYPGLVKDIYMGKGSYNQDLMSKAVLLEFGTHKSEKNEVLASTAYMADVLNRALYGGVSGAAGKAKSTAKENEGGWTGVGWLVVIGLSGLFLYAFAASGNLKTAGAKMKRSFQEMTGGLLGERHDNRDE